MKASRRTATMVVVVGALVAGIGIGQIPLTGAAPTAKVAVSKEPSSYREVVKKVLPTVVSVQITSKAVAKAARQNPAIEEDDFEFPIPDSELRKYLEELRKRRGDMDSLPIQQFGSGVMIDPKGIVVTNHHVVSGADQVEVTFKDGTKCVSKEIFSDPKTDLAIVKLVCPSPVPYADLGDSDAMEIGDRVLAVGAPFGLSGTVTHGIVSGKGRVLGMSIYEDYLQTDAAINPGNSGGPLVNMEGQVIGINTAIKSRTGGFQGVGLAIPSNMVKDIVEQLKRDGSVRRGYLGIQMQELKPDLADRLGLQGQKGVVVSQIMADTPADKAGLKEGDVIVALAGKPVEEPRILQRAVTTAPIGKPVELTVIRDGKRQTLKVTIEKQPDEFGVARIDSPRRSPRKEAETVPLDKLGIDVTDLTPEMAERLGVKETKGAVITDVEAGGLAQLGGLQRGMVIVQAEKKPVESAAKLKEVLNNASLEKGVLLLVRAPQGGTRYIILKASS